MFTLAFDTTAESCSIALLSDTTVVEKFCKSMVFGQSEALLSEIDTILKKHQLGISSLNLLAVCIGPGSFTGVRSSIAAARAFALACPNLNVTGVTAFEAYVHSLDITELAEIIAVIIETKREDFYVQFFNCRLQKISDALALPYEEIIKTLKGKTVTLIGNGVERFLDKPSGLVLHAVRMDKNVDITQLATCATEKYNAKKLNYPKPLYLRAPDVCVKS